LESTPIDLDTQRDISSQPSVPSRLSAAHSLREKFWQGFSLSEYRHWRQPVFSRAGLRFLSPGDTEQLVWRNLFHRLLSPALTRAPA